MEQEKELLLLKENFKKVEEKFDDFFSQGSPRWPGEQHDLLRNHHKNLDNLYIKSVSFEKLALTELPENIIKELGVAFEAFKRGEVYK